MKAVLRQYDSKEPRRDLGSDAVLAVLVIAIITLMVLPMPMFLLDALVALNISLGIILVLMGIYIQTPLQFSAFPSVLLISTLFRLSLSVATTRMILLEGEAGAIIDTFGSMVAGGNIVVGLVVFLIITLVQFLVIAKGAERVAEVGARFTLDAMPGKQMSIDSDLRTGLIDKTEARRKRREVELESKLHGSMDGAMKFVKGDAIAGLVIILINLLGGLAIGVFQFGMSAGDAAAKYSILTIGDGLVAQIPALLGAMSAGLIVTRVTDGDTDRHLGDSIGKQIFAIPRVLIVAGFICVAAALVPGFPGSTFVVLGAILSITGALLIPAFKTRVEKMTQPAFEKVMKRRMHPHSDIVETGALHDDRSVPILLAVPAAFAFGDRDMRLRACMEKMLEERRMQSGVLMPKMHFHWHNDNNTTWTLNAWEVPIASGELSADMSAEQAENTIRETCSQALRRQASLFVDMQETSNILSRASSDMPEIVKEAVRVVPIQNVARILRHLVEEEVPIRNIRGILEALVQAGQQDKNVGNLVEYARMALGRQICHAISSNGRLSAVALEPALEEFLVQSLRTVQDTQQFTLDPARKQRLTEVLHRAYVDSNADAVIVRVALRRHIRILLAGVNSDAPVLSHAEIPTGFKLELVDRLDEARLNIAPTAVPSGVSSESSTAA